jgi:hypothetical protein
LYRPSGAGTSGFTVSLGHADELVGRVPRRERSELLGR